MIFFIVSVDLMRWPFSIREMVDWFVFEMFASSLVDKPDFFLA